MDRLFGSPTPIGLGRPCSPGGFSGEVRGSIPGQGREIFKISALLLVVSLWAVGGCRNLRARKCKSLPFCLVSVFPRSFSLVAQSCPTLCDPMDCSMPGLLHDHPVYLQSSSRRLAAPAYQYFYLYLSSTLAGSAWISVMQTSVCFLLWPGRSPRLGDARLVHIHMSPTYVRAQILDAWEFENSCQCRSVCHELSKSPKGWKEEGLGCWQWKVILRMGVAGMTNIAGGQRVGGEKGEGSGDTRPQGIGLHTHPFPLPPTPTRSSPTADVQTLASDHPAFGLSF